MTLVLMYLYSIFCIYRTPKKVFVGATEDWSPTAEYATVPSFLDTPDDVLHRELDEICGRLHDGLEWWENFTTECLLVKT